MPTLMIFDRFQMDFEYDFGLWQTKMSQMLDHSLPAVVRMMEDILLVGVGASNSPVGGPVME